jgi:type VI secretion system secreted protein Hcp
LLAATVLAGAGLSAPTARAQVRARIARPVIVNPGSTSAEVDYFLKIDGVDGESKDTDHQNWIDIQSWSWGEPGSAASRRAPARDGSGTVTIVKTVDRSSPPLTEACTSGRSLGRIVLHARAPGGGYEEYVLDDTTVRSCASGSSDDRPAETITLNFGKVESSTRPGGDPDRPIVTGR